MQCKMTKEALNNRVESYHRWQLRHRVLVADKSYATNHQTFIFYNSKIILHFFMKWKQLFRKLAIVRKSFPNLAISYRFVSFSVALSFTVLSARRSHCLLPSYITVLLTIIAFLSFLNFRFTRDSTIVGNFILSNP